MTYGEAFTVQPFNNLVVTQTLTGAQLKNVLEQQFVGFAVTLEKFGKRLAVGQVQAAASRHEKLAAERRHLVVDRDGHARSSQALRRDQPGGTAADDGGIFALKCFGWAQDGCFSWLELTAFRLLPMSARRRPECR